MKLRTRGIIILAILAVMGCLTMNGRLAYASSAMIEFSVEDASITTGSSFNIIMTVTATDNIKSIDTYVTYDSSIMTFVSGGKYISGGDGLLHIMASELDGDKNRVKFSIQFNAIAKGNGAIGLSDTATVTDTSDKGMSTSSNRVSVSISGEPVDSSSSDNTAAPAATPEASGDNRLDSLLVSSGRLKPEFDPEVGKYSLTVDNNTSTLYFSYKTADENAIVRFAGNENLSEGKNTVKVIVTAPNNEERTYVIKVKKETAQETQAREFSEGMGSSGLELAVREENGEVYISNSYDFRIVDVEDNSKIPAGYVKTSVRLYGVNVTAYTMANDLDNEFLLMYCMNGNGDKEFYQYDRQEKSLQRYTGNLVDRVNSNDAPDSSENMTAKQYEDNLGQLAIVIAILAAVCVLLVICIISMALRQIKRKSFSDEDELDF